VDNVFVAMAGLGLIVVGIVGLAFALLVSLVMTARFVLVPRLAPMFARARAGAVSWIAPPPRQEVALVRSERPRR
jgi:hypothetical protein